MGPQPPRGGGGGGDGLRVAGGVQKGGKGGKGESKGAYQGIQFMKSYGQHILKNPMIVNSIVEKGRASPNVI